MTQTLTTATELVPLVQQILETHFEPRKALADRAEGYHVDSPRDRAVRGECRFDGLMSFVHLTFLEDGALYLSIRVVPAFGGYATTLLPEDVTEERILRHVERGVRLIRADIARRHAERAEAVRAYVPD